MRDSKPSVGPTAKRNPVRTVLVAAGVALVVVILIAVAIYAGAFLILAPMMQ